MDYYQYEDRWHAPEREAPGRLMRQSLIWLMVIFLAAFLSPALYGFVIGFHNSQGGPPWRIDAGTSSLVSGLGLQITMVVVSLTRGRSIGSGSLEDGLALFPIERPGLLIVFMLGTMLVPGFMALLLHALINEPLGFLIQDRLHQAYGGGPPATLGAVFLTIVFAPIAEELFFRGWLWTGLSRHWSPRAVFLATAIPFLLCHLPGGLYKPIVLIPATICISLARHCCGSIRASMLVHAMNNLAAMALMVYVASF